MELDLVDALSTEGLRLPDIVVADDTLGVVLRVEEAEEADRHERIPWHDVLGRRIRQRLQPARRDDGAEGDDAGRANPSIDPASNQAKGRLGRQVPKGAPRVRLGGLGACV